jgi:SAM-dependent methyltransferase
MVNPAKTPLCPVCLSKRTDPFAKARDLEYLTSNEVFAYYHCASCGALFLHPVPSGRLREIYPPSYYSFHEGKDSLVEMIKQALDRRMFAKALRDLPGDELSVLDVGGGTGWLLDLVRASDLRVKFTQVVDMDPQAKRAAVSKGHAFFQGTIERFRPNRKFDLVLMINLIEHVKDPVAILQKVEKLLKPGGMVLIKTPNSDSLDARIFRHRNWGGYHCPRHWVLFEENSLRKALSRTRLGLSSLRYTQGAPFWAQSLMMGLFQKGNIRYTREKPLVVHPLFAPLAAFFAAFDLLRSPFMKTSQMVILLKKPL